MWGIENILPPGLLAFAAGYAAMLVVPGPSFAVVSQASISASRREAGLVAVGVASGASLLVLAVTSGAASLPVSGVLAEFGRLVCTLLLLIVGYRALRRALTPRVLGHEPEKPFGGRHFAVGLMTAAANPISFAFFSSAALAARSDEASAANVFLPVGVFVMALGWFGLLAVLLSLPAVKRSYGRAVRHLDGITGAMLIAIALWMLVPEA